VVCSRRVGREGGKTVFPNRQTRGFHEDGGVGKGGGAIEGGGGEE